MNLLPEERETIIGTNDDMTEWRIYSCQRKIWNKMIKLGVEPYKIDKDENEEVIAQYYTVPYKAISIRNPITRELTEEQRQQAAERLKQARMNKSTE